MTLRTAVGGLQHRLALWRCRIARGERGLLSDLILLFVLALGVRVIWACITPPWQGPDEPAHFAYVAHIVEQAEIPYVIATATLPAYSNEMGKSWELSLLRKISTLGAGGQPEFTVLPAAYDYRRAREYRADHQDRLNAGGSDATSYSPLFYLLEAIPYWLFRDAPIISRLYAARVMVAVMGALSCVFGYLVAYEVRRTRSWGKAVGLSMALLPMFSFITSIVNNDSAMVLCSTILIWMTLRVYQGTRVSRPDALVLGIVSVLTILAKPTALPIVAVSGLVIVWRFFPLRRGPWRLHPQRLQLLGVYVAAAILTYIPYFWLQKRLAMNAALVPNTGAIASGDASSLLFATPRYSFETYLGAQHRIGGDRYVWLLIRTFWGNFGWLDVPLPAEVYVLIELLCIVGLTCFVARVLLRQDCRGPLLLLLGFTIAQVAFIFLVIDYYLYFARTGGSVGLQGRYFFPALAPFLIILLSGWSHLFDEHPRIVWLAPWLMLIVQLIGIATLLAHYYGVVLG